MRHRRRPATPKRFPLTPAPRGRPMMVCGGCGWEGQAAPGTECPECDKPLYPGRKP